MKNIRYTNTLVVMALLTCLFCACSSDESSEPTLQELAFEKLAGAWTLRSTESILLDDQDVSLNYPGFSLSFADGTYQTQNGGDLFSASGTWQWTNSEAGALLLDTGEEVTIIALSETRFQFSFTHASTGGEAAGTAGGYVVTVEK